MRDKIDDLEDHEEFGVIKAAQNGHDHVFYVRCDDVLEGVVEWHYVIPRIVQHATRREVLDDLDLLQFLRILNHLHAHNQSVLPPDGVEDLRELTPRTSASTVMARGTTYDLHDVILPAMVMSSIPVLRWRPVVLIAGA